MKYLAILLVGLFFVGCKKSTNEKADETIYVRHEGADMPVYIKGNLTSKALILVVHGGPGGNGLEYRNGKYAEELEENFVVAYWDQRGQGMSHGNYDKDKVTVQMMADDMRAVVLTLKAKYGDEMSIFALGHSWGGALTAKYMVTDGYQSLLNGWIESNGAHDIPKLNKDAILMFRQVASEQIAAGNSVDNWQGILDWANGVDENNITSQISGEINQNGHKVEQWLKDDGVILKGEDGGNKVSLFFDASNPITSSVSGNQTSSALSDEVENTALTSELTKVNIPTLLLWGKYDFVVPPSLGTDALNTISTPAANKKLVIYEKSGHSPMGNEWLAYTNEVIEFVKTYK